MSYETKKNWTTEKQETPEEKFIRIYEEFKTDVIRSGILKTVKDHEYYIKPSQKKRMKLAESKMKAKQNQKRRTRGN